MALRVKIEVLQQSVKCNGVSLIPNGPKVHVIVAVLLDTRDFHFSPTLLYRGKILLQFVNGTIIGKIPLLVAVLFLLCMLLIGARYLESVRVTVPVKASTIFPCRQDDHTSSQAGTRRRKYPTKSSEYAR